MAGSRSRRAETRYHRGMRRYVHILGISLLVASCSSRDSTRGGTDAGGIDSATSRTDAGTARDAGATTDAATGADAGSSTDAGGPDDAGSTVEDAGSGGRTVVTEACARSFGSCANDGDCVASGCGGETCAPEEVVSTCDCVAPTATCGCVAGACAWYR